MKNIIPEGGKNTMGGINFRLDATEEKMSELEDIALENTHSETRRKMWGRQKKK